LCSRRRCRRRPAAGSASARTTARRPPRQPSARPSAPPRAPPERLARRRPGRRRLGRPQHCAWRCACAGRPRHSPSRRRQRRAAPATRAHAVRLGAPLNATACRNRTALHWANLLGHEQVAEALLVGKCEGGKGAKVDPLDSCDERTPLMLASMRGHAGVVRVLLAHGAKKERTAGEGQTALDFAKEGGHEAVVELLM